MSEDCILNDKNSPEVIGISKNFFLKNGFLQNFLEIKINNAFQNKTDIFKYSGKFKNSMDVTATPADILNITM